MKKIFSLPAAALAAVLIFSGCTENEADVYQAEAVVSESITTEFSEIETVSQEIVETTASQTEETETTISETEAEIEDIQPENSADDTFPDMNVEEMLELINANSKVVGNDTCGYITVYAGSEYEEGEGKSYTVTSETSVISVFRYDYDFQTDLDMTAYMICLSAAMNAEEEGYEIYSVNEFSVDGMDGYLAIMIDGDTDLGFMMYGVVIDTAETLRGISCECKEYTIENIVSQGWAFDSYSRSLPTE